MDVMTAIRTLRSVRQYRDEPVEDAILTRILEAGRWAGSAKNTQPWQYLLVKDRATLTQLATCGSYASHLRDAACAIIVVTPVAARAAFDSGRTIQNMLLAAWAEGVGSCIVSLPREADVKQILGIPESYTVQQAIALGYPLPGAVPMVEGKPLEEVLASLGRKPLQDLVHHESWGRTEAAPGDRDDV
jgi:nitroreductase